MYWLLNDCVVVGRHSTGQGAGGAQGRFQHFLNVMRLAQNLMNDGWTIAVWQPAAGGFCQLHHELC